MNLMATSPLPPSLVAPSLAPILTPMCVITFFSEVSHLMQDVSHSPSPHFSCPYFTPTSPAPILPHFSCPYFTPNVCDYLFSDVSHLMQDVSHSPSPHFSCPYFTPTFPAPILPPFLMPLFYPHFSCPYFTPMCVITFSLMYPIWCRMSLIAPALLPLFYPHFSCPYFTPISHAPILPPMCVITFSLMYPIWCRMSLIAPALTSHAPILPPLFLPLFYPHFSCPYFTPNVCDYLFSDVSHLMQDVSHSPSPHFSCPYFTPTFPAPILPPFLMPLFYPQCVWLPFLWCIPSDAGCLS